MYSPTHISGLVASDAGQLHDFTKSCFVYQPLDLSTDSIRLVRVLPEGPEDAPLQLELWHSVLPACSYRCVSYRWGEFTPRNKVLLNGYSYTVGGNLHAFLQEVRIWAKAGFNHPLWVDAICIDQGSAVERGHQVQRMGTIYSYAQEVFLWLGDHGEFHDAALDWLRAQASHHCPDHLRQQWNAIRLDPYWSRAWIKQEILLAKRVTVAFRGATIEWTVLGNAIARSGSLDRLDDEHAAHLWSFWGERWMSKHETRKAEGPSSKGLFSFWSLMHMHRRSECTDRRDRIYSLLGLVDGEHNFTVDYEETVADLFWRVGEHFDAWSPELVDILKVALLDDHSTSGQYQTGLAAVSPWSLVQSLRSKPGMHIRIPIRRVTPTKSFTSRIRGSVRCRFGDCKQSPRLQCTRDDLLICTNARSDEQTEHGCIHAIAHPLDKPAAEPFEVKVVAHHREQIATTTLLSTAIQVFDVGTEKWHGVSTWSSLQKALATSDLDRVDRVKLSVPAQYAIWIWFGVHPRQLDDAYSSHDTELPSAHHALPNGTKITKDSVELPAT